MFLDVDVEIVGDIFQSRCGRRRIFDVVVDVNNIFRHPCRRWQYFSMSMSKLLATLSKSTPTSAIFFHVDVDVDDIFEGDVDVEEFLMTTSTSTFFDVDVDDVF